MLEGEGGVRAAVGRLSAIPRAVDGALVALRDRLTPGQRWTAALAMVLVILILLFGMPTQVVIEPVAPALASPSSDGGTGGTRAGGAAASPSTPGSAAGSGGGEYVLPPSSSSGDGGTSSSAGAGASSDEGSSAPSAPFAVAVVLGTGGLPGRGDAEMAAAFVGPSTAVPAGGDCGAAGAATLVVSPDPLDAELVSCLVGRGTTVVAPHPDGSATPHRLSTRRGAAAALADVASLVSGRVGVVLGASLESSLRPALSRLPNVVATAVVEDPVADVADGVQAFVAARVQTVVFAVPVDVQRRWVGQQSVLGAPGRWVVADVYDAVASEAYPPMFDGALAVTSSRLPWYARDHGETPEQTACADKWAEVAPPGMLPGESARVLAWCLLGSVVAAARGGSPLAGATVASPTTSSLGPLPGGGWGPTEDATLVWRSECGCWRERTPFRVRTAA